jgi:7-keto-8-aminopelargonate synthetase-like enzyme
MVPLDRIVRGEATTGNLSALLLSKLQAAAGNGPLLNAHEHGIHTGLALAEAEPEDFSAAAEEVPQIYAVVTEQIGRKVKVAERWIFDFASCNYLGVDLQPEVMAAIPPALEKWGVHPSWTRAVASPGIYEDLEQALANLVGAPSTLVFPAVTLLHAGVIPVLAGADGVIFKDVLAHRSMIEACRLAQTYGSEYVDFKHNDPDDLEERLASYPFQRTKLIVIDGVYSMSGEYAPLPEFARLAKRFNAWVYMDDAHGIGVIGEDPSPTMPYGHKGNGLARYYDLDYVQDRLVYVAGLSKSFSSFGAFITCNDLKMKNLFRSAASFIFSGPSPVASLASALAGLQLNQRDGEAWRARLYNLTHRLIAGAKALGYEVINDNDFPIVCVVIGKTRDLIEACKILWEYGILITPAMYPITPKDKGLLRFSVTAANTEDEIGRALEALAAVRSRLLLPVREPMARQVAV